MKVPAIDAYSNPYVNRVDGYGYGITKPNKTQQTTDSQKVEARDNKYGYKLNNNPQEIVSDQERKFFMKLFPENSRQIERHVLFDQRGRLQTPSISKGQIIDGRV